MPIWALTVAYWLHMAATVLWVGGLLFQSLVLQPVLAGALPVESIPPLLYRMRRRFQPLAWICLSVLVGTGLMQMTANPNYLGFVQFTNTWSQAILIKHIAILGMVLVAAYQTWWLGPRLEISLLLEKKGVREQEDPLRAFHRLTWVNTFLSLLVLALTAIARTA
ncbi:MAG: CopD family protein [Anaerolineales bacterium]